MANEMWLKVRTMGNASPQGKSRVYFSCHPEDREKYFDITCEQILSVNDCAIYYTEDARYEKIHYNHMVAMLNEAGVAIKEGGDA